MRLQLMDRSQTAIRSLLGMHLQFYSDETIRSEIESSIKAGWKGVPIEIQIRTVIALGNHAVQNEDSENAQRLAAEADGMVRSANFTPQWFIRLLAPVASLKHAAGQEGACSPDA